VVEVPGLDRPRGGPLVEVPAAAPVCGGPVRCPL
jgi:hypothetical protein